MLKDIEVELISTSDDQTIVDPEKQFHRALDYCQSDLKCEKKYVYWLTKSADQGFSDAQFALGVCYEHGRGVDVDYKRAFELYTKSALQGDSEAQYNLSAAIKTVLEPNPI